MAAIWVRLRSELRARWRGWVVLALLFGFLGGVVLVAAAGSRRTDTAYTRLLRSANAADVFVVPHGSGFPGYYGALARLAEVAAVSPVARYNVGLPGPGGVPDTNLVAEASIDGAWGHTIDRVKVVAGAFSDLGDPRSVVVDRQLAAKLRLRPGSALRLLDIPNDAHGNPDVAHAIPLTFRVSGVAIFDFQIVPSTHENSQPRVLMTPAFYRTARGRSLAFVNDAVVRLRSGTPTATFARDANALAARFPETGDGIDVVSRVDEAAVTERAIRPEAFTLAVFAAVAGVIVLAAIAQLLRRQVMLEAAEYPTLRAFGMTRRTLSCLSLARVGLITGAGGLVAVAGAILASPLMPVGPARIAEPHPGFELNLAILALGFIAIVVLPVLLVAPTVYRTALANVEVAAPAGGHPSRAAAAIGVRRPVVGILGVRMAVDGGHGRTALPVRSTLTGITAALTAMVAAIVFGASLARLVDTPSRYGQNWDRQLDLGFGGVSAVLASQIAARQPEIIGYAGGDYGVLTIGTTRAPAIGIDELRGHDFLTMLAGNRPTTPQEIVLGSRTLNKVHARIGQDVSVSVNGRSRKMRIVGEAVFASFSRGTFSETGLGTGAAVSASVLSVPSDSGCTPVTTCYNFFLLRYRPGTELRAASTRLEQSVTAAGCPPGFCSVIDSQRPRDIGNYTRVRNTPLALAAVLALLAIAMLAHVLLVGAMRRRRDLAILKTLGLTKRQVFAAVTFQATTIAGAALALGIPTGVAAGRWTWAIFAHSLGAPTASDTPLIAVLLVIPITLALANAIATAPAWRAAHAPASPALRTG